MCTHNDLVSIGVNVTLAQRQWLRQNIVACAHQINKEHFMVFDEAENSLIVVARALWAERNNDPLRGVGFHGALSH